MTGPRSQRRSSCTSDRDRILYAAALSARVIETRRILQGARVALRPLAAGDLRKIVKWYSDPRVIHFLGRGSPVTLAEEERWFRDYERKPDEQIFAIEGEGDRKRGGWGE